MKTEIIANEQVKNLVEQFKLGGEKSLALLTTDQGNQNHIVGIYIVRGKNGEFVVNYLDPIGDPIKNQKMREGITDALGVEHKIRWNNNTTKLQSDVNSEHNLDFAAYILTGMQKGDLTIGDISDGLQMAEGGSIFNLDEEESKIFGEKLNEYHSQVLERMGADYGDINEEFLLPISSRKRDELQGEMGRLTARQEEERNTQRARYDRRAESSRDSLQSTFEDNIDNLISGDRKVNSSAIGEVVDVVLGVLPETSKDAKGDDIEFLNTAAKVADDLSKISEQKQTTAQSRVAKAFKALCKFDFGKSQENFKEWWDKKSPEAKDPANMNVEERNNLKTISDKIGKMVDGLEDKLKKTVDDLTKNPKKWVERVSGTQKDLSNKIAGEVGKWTDRIFSNKNPSNQDKSGTTPGSRE